MAPKAERSVLRGLEWHRGYVGCDRDREVVAVNVASPTAGAFLARIQLDGNPNGMTLSADGSKLYAAQDNQDQVAVIDTASNKVIGKIDTRGPASLDFPRTQRVRRRPQSPSTRRRNRFMQSTPARTLSL